LTLLRASCREDNRLITILSEVNPVARSEINPAFMYSLSDALTLDQFPPRSWTQPYSPLQPHVHRDHRTRRQKGYDRHYPGIRGLRSRLMVTLTLPLPNSHLPCARFVRGSRVGRPDKWFAINIVSDSRLALGRNCSQAPRGGPIQAGGRIFIPRSSRRRNS